jgi:hypothetical protein
MIRESTDQRYGSLYTLEEGITVWESILSSSTTLSPFLHALYPWAVELALELASEPALSIFGLLKSYLLFEHEELFQVIVAHYTRGSICICWSCSFLETVFLTPLIHV